MNAGRLDASMKLLGGSILGLMARRRAEMVSPRRSTPPRNLRELPAVEPPSL
ncbi:MAG: hypothetical protein QXW58_02970 [Thermosphaera sp.]